MSPFTRPGGSVMAIVNATPDSFSDGGTLPEGAALLPHLEALVEQGADILDVGGESTRPGATPIDADVEWRRIQPALAVATRLGVPVSVDTSKGDVARRALGDGATIVNDVRGGDDARLLTAVAAADAWVVLMRHRPLGPDLVASCADELRRLQQRAIAAGVDPAKIVLDPGLGFGDPPGADVQANLELVMHVRRLATDAPILIGASRKRFVGALTGESEPLRRVAGSVAVACLAIACGAAAVRVHDVGATRTALDAVSRPRSRPTARSSPPGEAPPQG